MEEPARAAVLCLGALARLARVHILSDVIILAHAEGQAQHQRPRLGAPKMPPERAVMAVAEHLCPPPAAGTARRLRGCRGVHSALSAAVKEAATHQKLPSLRGVCGVGDWGATPIDEPAQRCSSAANDWPQDQIDGKLRRHALHERRREKDVVRQDWLRRSQCGASAQREFLAAEQARAMNILVHGGVNNTARPTRAAWSGVRSPPGRSVAVRKSALRQRVCRVACTWQVHHVEVEVLNLVEPTDVHLLQMQVRLQPRDRLLVCPQVKIRPAPLLPGRRAAEQVVSEHQQRVDHHQQLQDMLRVVPLGRRQHATLSSLKRHQTLQALVVWLRQDSHYCEVACVSSQDLAAGRVKHAQHRGRGEGLLQRVKALLRSSGSREARSHAAERRQQRHQLCVALHEAAVVVCEPREAAHLGARRWRYLLDDGLHLALVHLDACHR